MQGTHAGWFVGDHHNHEVHEKCGGEPGQQYSSCTAVKHLSIRDKESSGVLWRLHCYSIPVHQLCQLEGILLHPPLQGGVDGGKHLGEGAVIRRVSVVYNLACIRCAQNAADSTAQGTCRERLVQLRGRDTGVEAGGASYILLQGILCVHAMCCTWVSHSHCCGGLLPESSL